MHNQQDIYNRLAANQPVTIAEFVLYLSQDKHAFFAFIIENNNANINDTLRHKLGYTELGFEPDNKKIGRIIDMLIDKNELDELKTVLANFRLNETDLNPEFLKQFKQKFA